MSFGRRKIQSTLTPERVAQLLCELKAARKRVAELTAQLEQAGVLAGSLSVLFSRLSERERQVAMLYLKTPSDREVAAELGTSPHTVRNQITRIRKKLGVTTRKSLLLRLLEERPATSEA